MPTWLVLLPIILKPCMFGQLLDDFNSEASGEENALDSTGDDDSGAPGGGVDIGNDEGHAVENRGRHHRAGANHSDAAVQRIRLGLAASKIKKLQSQLRTVTSATCTAFSTHVARVCFGGHAPETQKMVAFGRMLRVIC